MAEIYSNTHGMVAAGAGGTAAGETLIGTITLPAGGPWIIHEVWAQVVDATATAAESVGGYFRLDVASGDLTPNPAPSRFPCISRSSFLGALADRTVCPRFKYKVNYEAAGKAVINLIAANNTAVTVAPQWVIGIIFSATMPEETRYQFCDQARGTINAAALTAIGTIQLSEKATKIVGFAGTLSQTGVLVAGEELIGFATLTSDDVTLPPMQLPFNCAFGAGLGATIDSNSQPAIEPVLLDIPVYGGARINCAVDLNTAVTNAADVAFYLFYV